MALREQVNEDMKSAMKARESEKLGAIRLLLSEVKRREVDERVTLDDAGVISVVEKMIKQRKDSISQYEKAARQDLADKEKFEIGILEAYLPQQLSDKELGELVEAAIAETGASEQRQMGQVMSALMPKLGGRADGKRVSAAVQEKLGT